MNYTQLALTHVLLYSSIIFCTHSSPFVPHQGGLCVYEAGPQELINQRLIAPLFAQLIGHTQGHSREALARLQQRLQETAEQCARQEPPIEHGTFRLMTRNNLVLRVTLSPTALSARLHYVPPQQDSIPTVIRRRASETETLAPSSRTLKVGKKDTDCDF